MANRNELRVSSSKKYPWMIISLILHAFQATGKDVPKIVSVELSNPYISVSKMFHNFKATAFSIDCLIRYENVEDTEENFALLVEFYSDTDKIATFVDSYPTENVELFETYFRGQLGKNITCKVQIMRDSNGTTTDASEVYVSAPYNLEIYVANENGTRIKELKVKQGLKITLIFKTTFPLTTRHCVDQHSCELKKSLFEAYSLKRGINQIDCRILFYSPHGSLYYVSNPVIIMASITVGTEQTSHAMVFKTYRSINQNVLLQGYTIPPFMIDVIEEIKLSVCHSTGDPHFITFSGVKFDNYFVGEYRLLATSHRTLQVQVRQINCGIPSPTGPSCICGLIVREGNNVLGVTACDNKPNFAIVELMRDNSNPLAIIEADDKKYTIRFVSGIKVEAEPFTLYGHKFLNVYIFPLKHEKYTGICTLTAPPVDFNAFLVTGKDSFFSEEPPNCVNEVFNLPSCRCETKAGENVTLSCGFESDKEFSKIVKMKNICNTKDAPTIFKRSADGEDKVFAKKEITLEMSNDSPFTYVDLFGNLNKTVVNTKDVSLVISKSEAKSYCVKKVESSQFSSKCKEALTFDVYESLIENCADDVAFSGSFDPAGSVIRVFESLCSISVQREIEIVNGSISASSEKYVSVENEISEKSCSACSNNGTCSQGKCTCTEGFTGADCSHEKNKSPTISLSRARFCDANTAGCHLIKLEVIVNPEAEESIKCKGGFVGETTQLAMSEVFIQPGFMQCKADSKVLNLKEMQKAKMEFLLYITVSNDGIELKSNELDLVIYDSTCFTCREAGCKQNKMSCIIDGACYEADHVLDSSHYCNPSLSMNSWTLSDKPLVVKKGEIVSTKSGNSDKESVSGASLPVIAMHWVIAIVSLFC